MTLSALAQELVGRGEITAQDVLALRARVYGDHFAVSADEVEALFAIDEGTRRRVREWREFFCEVLTDWMVRQQEPAGYVTQAQADWLIQRIGADRKVRDGTELEAVLRVLEQADSAPASLAAFGLQLVTRAVVENDGVITRGEVERLRRLMFAPAGPDRLRVSRQEAEALFDLNDATRGRANDPSWKDFFMRAVANAVTAAAGWIPPGREEALRRERWLAGDEPDASAATADATVDGSGAGPFVRRIREAIAALGEPSPFKVRQEEQEQAHAAAAPVDEAEARWLVERIGRDGALDENERALVDFLRELAPSGDRLLNPLLERAAA